MKHNFNSFIVIIASLLFNTGINAQTLVPSTFLTNGKIKKVIHTKTNEKYIIGDFSKIGTSATYETIIDSNGTAAKNIPEANGMINAVIPDNQGGWYVGGEFTTIAGQARKYLAHIKSDGTLDTWNPAPDNKVQCLYIDKYNNLFVGGFFTSILGQSRSRVAKIKMDGTLDTWNPGPNNYVDAITSDKNDNIYIGGDFATVKGVTHTRIAKINADGTVNSAFTTSVSGVVNTILVDDSLNIYFGGYFTTVNGSARSNVAKLNADGSLNTWNPGANANVMSIVMDKSGNIYLGGAFSSAGGASKNGLAKIKPNGTADPSFPSCNAQVYSLKFDKSDDLYVGGVYQNIYGSTSAARYYIAKIKLSGTIDTWSPDFCGEIKDIAVDNNKRVFVAGYPIIAQGLSRNTMAKIKSDGSIDSLDFKANGIVYTACLDKQDNVYIGGAFTSIGGQARSRIAKFNVDGSLSPLDIQANNTINVLALGNDGLLYMGGSFTTIGGQIRNRLARVSTSGILDAWNPNASNSVNIIVFDKEQNIIVGGNFTTLNGITRNRVARFTPNGTLTSWDPNAGGTVAAIAYDNDNAIYIGGYFTSIAGKPQQYIAKFNPDGTLSTWNPNVNTSVFAILVDYNDDVYIGGNLTQIDGQSSYYIAKTNKDGLVIKLPFYFNSFVYDITFDNERNIAFAGLFTAVKTQKAYYYALIDMPALPINAYSYTVDSVAIKISMKDSSSLSTNYFWQLGNATVAYDKNPEATYINGGYVRINQTVMDSLSGKISQKEQIVFIDNGIDDCEAEFLFSVNVTDKSVQFFNTSLGDDNASYLWNFGNGDTSLQKHPVYTYSSVDYYNTCLTVQTKNCKNITCKTIKNGNALASNAAFLYMPDSKTNTVYFNDKSDSAKTWLWDFGDGKTSIQQHPTHTYADTGLYHVKLTINNGSSIKQIAHHLINVHSAANKLKTRFISFSSSKNKGVLPVEFKGVNYGDAAELEWDFGDGTTESSTMYPIHDYKEPGTYYVCLTVKDPVFEQEDTYCDSITITTVAINDATELTDQFELYPNPAKSELIINNEKLKIKNGLNTSISITNTLGQDVFHSSFLIINSSLQIDVSQFVAGTYFLKLTTDNGVTVKKFVKQ